MTHRRAGFVAHALMRAASTLVSTPAVISHLLRLCPSVLLSTNLFAGRDNFQTAQVRRTQEHSPVRQHWEPCTGRVSPGTGRKSPRPGASFAPFRGWLISGLVPRAVRPGLLSFALRALYRICCLRLGRAVGQAVNLRTDWQSVQPGAARPRLCVGRTLP